MLVQGAGLTAGQALSCLVGGRPAGGTAASASEVLCTVPAGSPGFVGVSLGGGQAEEGAVFLYREGAHVRSLAPRSAWAERPTLVHVQGTGMVGSEAQCQAAGASVPGHQVSSALVVCEVPAAQGAEEVDVTVGSWEQAVHGRAQGSSSGAW